MKRTIIFTVAVALLGATYLSGHDMFLKFDTYFLAPDSEVSLALFNGTYDKSESVIGRERMRDVTIASASGRQGSPDSSQWSDREDITWLTFETGAPGTYLVGVSTRPNRIDLTAEDFNRYLAHDGVLDVLGARERDGELGQPASEFYSKHVKAIFQVGDARTDGYSRRLGYPIEIVPLENPYELVAGDRLDILVLHDGSPVAGQLVYASHAGYHGHDDSGGHLEAVRTRTDADGVAGIELSSAGRWYVRLIHMVEVDAEDRTHESNWATLTFEIAE